MATKIIEVRIRVRVGDAPRLEVKSEEGNRCTI